MDGASCMVRGMAVLVIASAFAGIAPAATKEALEREVQRFSVACATNDLYTDLYDCRCLTEGYRQAVKAADSTYRRNAIVRDSRLLASCPAPKQSVLSWFKRDCNTSLRKAADRAARCECGAERFATAFQAAPPASRREIALLKKASMQACGPGG